MQHSFAPTEVAIKDGVAQFNLPPEANVMRDRDWLCLIRVGDQIALCRDTLPSPVHPAGRGRMLVDSGPPVADPDQAVTVAGIWRSATRDPNQPPDAELRIVNAINDTIAKLELTPSPTGTVHAELPLGRALVGRRLRMTLHDDGRTVENAAGRLALELADPNPHALSATLDPLAWGEDDAAELRSRLCVQRPWGDATGGLARWQFSLRALPRAIGTIETGESLNDQGALDAAGARPIRAQPTHPVNTDHVALVELAASAFTTDGGRAVAGRTAVRTSSGAHQWLELAPQTPRVGEAPTIRLGAYYPAAWPFISAPRLQIARPDGETEDVAFAAGPAGFEILHWTPTQPGLHKFSVTAAEAAPNTPELDCSGAFEVAPRPAESAWAACRARLATSGDCEVAVIDIAGQFDRPLLVVVDDGDLLGIGALNSVHGGAHLELPLNRRAPRAIVRLLDHTLTTLAACRAARDLDELPTVSIEPRFLKGWPGESVTVDVLLERTPPGSKLIARLISSSEVGRLRSAAEASPMQPLTVRSPWDDPNALPRHAAPIEVALTDPLLPTMLEGETRWCTAAEVADDRVTLDVPLPRAAGRQHLLIAVETPAGDVGRGYGIMDSSSGVRVELSTPVHLEVGDQTCVGLRVQNLSDRARHVEMRLSLARPLDPRRCAGLPDETWRSLRDAAGWTPLTLAPGDTWARIDIAAVEPGDATIDVVLRGDDGETATRGQCVVRAAPTIDTGEPPLHIQRTITVWTPPRAAAPLAGPAPGTAPPPLPEQFASAGWQPAPWSPSTTLHLGQVLHVVESLTVAGARPSCAWRQRVPATCQPWKPADAEQRLIGTAEPIRGHTLTFRTDALQPGPAVHEYLLGVSRPGDCRLSPPDLDLLGRPLRVTVAPEEIRLVVTSESSAAPPH